jgi:hypothetical protein
MFDRVYLLLPVLALFLGGCAQPSYVYHYVPGKTADLSRRLRHRAAGRSLGGEGGDRVRKPDCRPALCVWSRARAGSRYRLRLLRRGVLCSPRRGTARRSHDFDRVSTLRRFRGRGVDHGLCPQRARFSRGRGIAVRYGLDTRRLQRTALDEGKPAGGLLRPSPSARALKETGKRRAESASPKKYSFRSPVSTFRSPPIPTARPMFQQAVHPVLIRREHSLRWRFLALRPGGGASLTSPALCSAA